MSLTVCLAPANTVAYPNGGGHLWVYLHWALALKALGCRVIWLEGIDVDDSDTSPAGRRRRRGGRAVDCVATLKTRLEPYGLADTLALYAMNGAAVPEDVAHGSLDLDAAAGADLLLNLWHSAPAPVVQRFRRSAFVDTDPGLLQIWMRTGAVDLAPHDIYFTIGETVGQPGAPFPDGGRAWLYTPPPIFLPEWPVLPSSGPGRYTTVAHWWGGTFEFNGTTFSNEKRASFLEYQDLPQRTPVPLELAVCLAEFHEEYRRMLEPKGWRLREAWDVTATPDAYRTYVQRSRGEFSCAKPAYVSLDTAWVSDRTLCYLASGKPAVVQHTGASRILPDAEGLLRFRSIDEAAKALAAAEADYERHGRAARALVEEHFDARQVVASVLERALEPRVAPVPKTQGVDLPRELLADLLDGTGRVADIRRLKERVYRLEMTNGPHRSVVVKRLEPAVAQRTRLVAERWLPALGLGDRCPRLLATAADRASASIWHAFEDLGDETLASDPTPNRVAATVDLMAQLHTRGARHPVLPDARRYTGALGFAYFTANVQDAIAALEALAAADIERPPEQAGVTERLLERLVGLRADAARRAQVFEEAAGPETLLHGDLWTINAFVEHTAAGPRARLVDWDRVGVGPFSYDLSTFLFRFPPEQRPRILECYRQAVAAAGWRLASGSELEVLFDTAEQARYANRVIWPALALVQEHAAWGFPELAEVERWFEALDAAGAIQEVTR